jgi:hypothetical protein
LVSSIFSLWFILTSGTKFHTHTKR